MTYQYLLSKRHRGVLLQCKSGKSCGNVSNIMHSFFELKMTYFDYKDFYKNFRLWIRELRLENGY